jgi:hypothetical protein
MRKARAAQDVPCIASTNTPLPAIFTDVMTPFHPFPRQPEMDLGMDGTVRTRNLVKSPISFLLRFDASSRAISRCYATLCKSDSSINPSPIFQGFFPCSPSLPAAKCHWVLHYVLLEKLPPARLGIKSLAIIHQKRRHHPRYLPPAITSR